MAAIRVTESSGSVGVIQSSNLFGGFEPTNILFNTASVGLQTGLSLGSDTVLFISGAIGSKGTTDVGVSVFGGDLVVSGTLYAERQVIEVDEVASGHLLVSGSLEVQDSISANAFTTSFSKLTTFCSLYLSIIGCCSSLILHKYSTSLAP